MSDDQLENLQEKKCPSCGAELFLENRFVLVVICDYCQSTLSNGAGGLSIEGKTNFLPFYPSRFSIGGLTRIQSMDFKILGRLRFDYSDGFWDEWYGVTPQGKEAWIHEDEGEVTLFKKENLTLSPPAFDSIQVGETISIQGKPIFVTEKRDSKISGGEGQLNVQVMPGELVRFVDGIYQGRLYSLEFGEREIEFCFGIAVNSKDIHPTTPPDLE